MNSLTIRATIMAMSNACQVKLNHFIANTRTNKKCYHYFIQFFKDGRAICATCRNVEKAVIPCMDTANDLVNVVAIWDSMGKSVIDAYHCQAANMVIAMYRSNAYATKDGMAYSVRTQFAVRTVTPPGATAKFPMNAAVGWAGLDRRAKNAKCCQAVNMDHAQNLW